MKLGRKNREQSTWSTLEVKKSQWSMLKVNSQRSKVNARLGASAQRVNLTRRTPGARGGT
jgi:hypothetical protein